MGSNRKTTFAKLSREAKLREKRALKERRKEERQRDAGGENAVHEVEDLSHLDVAVIEGVEPDGVTKR